MRSFSKRKEGVGAGNASQSIRASEGILTEESKSILRKKLSAFPIPQGGRKGLLLQMHGLNSPPDSTLLSRYGQSHVAQPRPEARFQPNSSEKQMLPAAGCRSKDLLPYSQETEADRLSTAGVHSSKPHAPHPTPCPSRADSRYLSATLASVIARGGTFQGQLMRPPGRRLKSNWQQILGSGPQVCGTS